jgi:hypothetical protein
MPQDHPRAGIPHDPADTFPHLPVVAMNRTDGTNRLVLTEETAMVLYRGIGKDLRTFLTHLSLRMMTGTAIHPDHRPHRFYLPLFPLFEYIDHLVRGS